MNGRLAVGHPIDVATGALFFTRTDVIVLGSVPLRLERRYDTSLLPRPQSTGALGPGWMLTCGQSLRQTLEGWTLCTADGSERAILVQPGELERTGRIVSGTNGLELVRHDADHVGVVSYEEHRVPVEQVFRRPARGRVWRLCSLRRDRHNRVDFTYDGRDRLVGLHQLPSGKRLRLGWSVADRLVDVHLMIGDSGELLAKYGYDERGRLQRVEDGFGVRERYEYDADGRVRTDARRTGAVYTMSYDREGRCIHAAGVDRWHERWLAYDAAARVTRVTDSHGHESRYHCNEQGQVVRLELPDGTTAEYAYAEGRLAHQKLPDGSAWDYEHDALGHLSAITAPGALRQELEHDARHRLVKRSGPGDATIEYTWDEADRLVAWTGPDGGVSRFSYDGLGNLAEIVDPLGGRTLMKYDTFGQRIGTRSPDGAVVTYDYDRYGRVIAERGGLGIDRRFEYDAAHRLTAIVEPWGRYEWRHTVDGASTVERAPDGRTRTVRRNACGLPLEVIEPDSSQWRMQWDSEPGRLLRIEGPGGAECAFDYDALGRLVKERYWDGRTRKFEWTDDRLSAIEDGPGRRTELEHDAVGRLVARRFGDEEIRYAYDDLGRLASAELPGSRIELEYDVAGRIVGETHNGLRIAHAYDACGRRCEWTGPWGDATRYRFSPAGMCVGVERDVAAAVFVRGEDGRELERRYGELGTFRQGYDAVGRVNEQHWEPKGAAAAIHREYRHDAAGRVAAMSDTFAGAATFSHDAVGRLRAARESDGTMWWWLSDVFDNLRCEARARVGTVVEPPPTSTDDAVAWARRHHGEAKVHHGARGNRLARSEHGERVLQYDYDAAGHVVEKRIVGTDGVRRWKFVWSGRGLLAEVETPDGARWHYGYDAAGRRIRKRGPGVDLAFVWDGATLLYEIDAAHGVSTWIVHPDDHSPLWNERGRHARYFIPDLAGNVREAIDDAGKIAWRQPRPPWDRRAGGDAAMPVHAAGHYHDAETGLDYNVYRYLDPDSGRYLSPDPMGLRAGTNEYAGVRDPLLENDSLGLARGIPAGPYALAQGPLQPGEEPQPRTAYPNEAGDGYTLYGDDASRPRQISMHDNAAAELHTDGEPRRLFVPADRNFDGRPAPAPLAGSPVPGNRGGRSPNDHHADQWMMRELLARARRGAPISGSGDIVIRIRGRPICPSCNGAIGNPTNMAAEIARLTGRNVVIESEADPTQNRTYSPNDGC